MAAIFPWSNNKLTSFPTELKQICDLDVFISWFLDMTDIVMLPEITSNIFIFTTDSNFLFLI